MIEAAAARDLPDVHLLLERHHLPVDGLDEHIDTMLVARDGSRVVGTAALEIYSDGALLRSVAVDPGAQCQRIGHALTDAALKMAQERGAPAVFLLTTTAERYFPRFGFDVITRTEVPASVQASIEFRSACPSSAVVMRKRLDSSR
jgi:amino-acid N-acetyltransferase